MKDLFGSISGQDQVVSYLQHVLDNDMATHAYLIAGGAPGEGEDIALRFATGLIAGDDEAALKQAQSLTHPDMHVYAPEGTESYLVDQIRELTHDAELAPIRAEKKVYIIQDAQHLAGSPANAFLKTLEEPPGNVTCILVANNESAVLETLKSRCEVLVLNSSASRLEANPEVFDMLDSLARGCGNRELFSGSKRFVEIAKDEAAKMNAGGMDAQAYIEKYEDYLSQGAKKQVEVQEKREATAHERAALLALCSLARSWLRDCLVKREGVQELLEYPQADAQTAMVARSSSTASVLLALDAVGRAMTSISYNVTPQLAIDAMFIEIREALCHK